MKPLNMVVFNKEKISDVLDLLDVKTVEVDKESILVDSNDEQLYCYTCHRPITLTDFGNVVPGSKKFFCKRATCFAKYLSEEKV